MDSSAPDVPEKKGKICVFLAHPFSHSLIYCEFTKYFGRGSSMYKMLDMVGIADMD